jgi:DNA-binding NtrC family response regulator
VGQNGLLMEGSVSAQASPSQAGSLPVVEQLLSCDLPLETLETMLIEAAVERAGGNLSEAARKLGLTRAQLAYRYHKVRGEG